ncbi:MAG: hypothetical protein ACRCZK_04010 [Oscillospiraceae bacterium]
MNKKTTAIFFGCFLVVLIASGYSYFVMTKDIYGSFMLPSFMDEIILKLNIK